MKEIKTNLKMRKEKRIRKGKKERERLSQKRELLREMDDKRRQVHKTGCKKTEREFMILAV